jgi:hypothetical protein
MDALRVVLPIAALDLYAEKRVRRAGRTPS